jgi:hypothetical protein
MIILTLKERQFIDDAVMRFSDDRERRIWRDWKLAHPAVRYDPASPVDDGTGRMPPHVTDVVVSALSRLERFLQTRIDSVEVSDDDAAELCNDVAEIRSTTEAIRTAA